MTSKMQNLHRCSECGWNLTFINKISIKEGLKDLYKCTSCGRLCYVE